MTIRSIPRRDVLSSLALSLLATSWPSAAFSGRDAASELLPHADAARLIGERYLVLVPEERSARRLHHALFGNTDTGDTKHQTLARLRELIDTRRRHDFTVGNTVILDGWLLARTEARLCALSVLA
jgi:hypothetical protein